ncbi:MAG TPA: sensor histidine kinase [Chloroflexaceae bacterium]|nr:sensor histidine kinase [Chloroflexaceae bacterium]
MDTRDPTTHSEQTAVGLLVEAAPLPIVAAVVARLGLEAAPAGPRALAVVAPPELVPRLTAALVSAGACVYRIAPLPRVRPHRRAAPRRPRLRHPPPAPPAAPPARPRRGIMAPFREGAVRNGWLQRFATIRWKLTGAFLAVSLLLALTMIAVFVAGVIYILNAPLLPRAIADSAREVSLTLAAELADPAGDPDQALRILTRFASPPREGFGEAGGEPQADDGRGDELLIAMLDTQGRVITSTYPMAYPAGLALAASEPAPAADLIVRALGGLTTTEQLSAWNRPDHQPIATAPIFSPEGEVIGAIYLRLVNFPSVGLFLANLTPFLVSFIVPWLLVSGGLGMLYSWLVGRGFARRIARLTEASVDLADGDLSRRIEDPSGDELGQLGRQFNAMADQLSESLRSLRLLAERNAQLAEQAAQLAAVEERNRIARDLHDSVSQELFSLTMLAAAARRTLDSRPDLAAARLAEIEESVRRALEETRGLIFALRPAALDGRGLVLALHDLAAALGERQGLAVDLRVASERRLPLDHEQAIFRIVQEALANVGRHSGVRAATVTLTYGDGAVALEVRDAGRGFDPEAARSPRAIGLLSMAERAEALGGTFAIASAPGQGTTISVTLPTSEVFRRPPAEAAAPFAERSSP